MDSLRPTTCYIKWLASLSSDSFNLRSRAVATIIRDCISNGCNSLQISAHPYSKLRWRRNPFSYRLNYPASMMKLGSRCFIRCLIGKGPPLFFLFELGLLVSLKMFAFIPLDPSILIYWPYMPHNLDVFLNTLYECVYVDFVFYNLACVLPDILKVLMLVLKATHLKDTLNNHLVWDLFLRDIHSLIEFLSLSLTSFPLLLRVAWTTIIELCNAVILIIWCDV